MRPTVALLALFLLAGAVRPGDAQTTPWADPSPHAVRFVAVEEGVRLEVLDWGGAGRPLLLLAGLGFTAHVYDEFAPALARYGRVYGVTRRGYGASDAPDHGYDGARLAADVLAVIDALGLEAPVVIGHSIAGQELSALAARQPSRIAGVVYLDAVWAGFMPEEVREAGEARTPPPFPPRPPPPQPADLESFAALRAYFARYQGYGIPEAELRQMFAAEPEGRVGAYRVNQQTGNAIYGGIVRHDTIAVPALVVAPAPFGRAPWTYDLPASDQALYDEVYRWNQEGTAIYHAALRRYVPHARIVEIAGGDHNIYGSHPERVLAEIRAFLEELDERTVGGR
jgi:non-heme chloroperoxidase